MYPAGTRLPSHQKAPPVSRCFHQPSLSSSLLALAGCPRVPLLKGGRPSKLAGHPDTVRGGDLIALYVSLDIFFSQADKDALNAAWFQRLWTSFSMRLYMMLGISVLSTSALHTAGISLIFVPAALVFNCPNGDDLRKTYLIGLCLTVIGSWFLSGVSSDRARNLWLRKGTLVGERP